MKSVSGVKLINRWAPSLIIYALFSLVFAGIIVCFALLPVMQISYNHGGNDVVASVNVINGGLAFFHKITTGDYAASDTVARDFMLFVYNPDGVDIKNPIILFFVKYYRFILLAVSVFFIICVLFALLEAIFALINIITGRTFKPKAHVVVAKCFFTFHVLFTVALIVFYYFYKEELKLVAPTAQLTSPFFLPLIYLGVSLIFMIVLTFMNKSLLEDRVYVKGGRKITKEENI